MENQDLKGRMREVQEEQRMLLDRISGLQLQLSEVKQPGNVGKIPGKTPGIRMLSWEFLPPVPLVSCWKSLWSL